MLSHQHTLLQHDFTQPPSNKKATKQNLSLAFSENLQISRQIITGDQKILSYFFLTCCDSELNIVEEFHSKSLSFKYHKFVELKNQIFQEDDTGSPDDELPARNCKKLWTQRHLSSWTDASGYHDDHDHDY